MKLNHKVNFGWSPPSDPINDRYQRELDETLRKAERAWRKAQQAAERAQRAATKRADPELNRLRDEAIAEVERRERELDEIRRLMAAPSYRQPAVVHRIGREERLETGFPKRRKSKPKSTRKVTTRRKS